MLHPHALHVSVPIEARNAHMKFLYLSDFSHRDEWRDVKIGPKSNEDEEKTTKKTVSRNWQKVKLKGA